MKNKVSIILVMTVAINMACTLIDWPSYKVTLLDGSQGFRLHWHIWTIKTYIIGLMLLSTRLVKEFTSLDKDIVITYLFFDAYSLLIYTYSGYPERKDLIVIGFCAACLIFIFNRKWTQK